jgi:hypothetical protein
VAIVVSTVLVALFDLQSFGVAVVGEVLAGSPRPSLPDLEAVDPAALVGAALGVTVVSYIDNVLTARSFAVRAGIGSIHTRSSWHSARPISQPDPVSSSGSRTAAGSRTQLHSLVALAVVLLTLLALRPVLCRLSSGCVGSHFGILRLLLIDVAELLTLLADVVEPRIDQCLDGDPRVRRPPVLTSGAIHRARPFRVVARMIRMPGTPNSPETVSYLRTLPEAECFELLAVANVGRVGFQSPSGVQIIPLSYRLGVSPQLFMKTAPGSAVAQLAEMDASVAFEVDYHADDFRTAWSVLMNGTISRLDAAATAAYEELRRPPVPWAGSAGSLPVRFVPRTVSGRGLHRTRPD